jgi:tetratricopeptide (TPR) repeat protein
LLAIQDQFKINPRSLEIYDLMDHWLLSSDLILVLLDLSPIDSSRIQYLVFLASKEVFYEKALDPVFSSTVTGPFSEVLKETMSILDRSTYLVKAPDSVFYITPIGRKELLNKLEQIKRFSGSAVDTQLLDEKTSMWTSMTNAELIAHIYTSYPEYFILEESKNRERETTLPPSAPSSHHKKLTQQIKRKLTEWMKWQREKAPGKAEHSLYNVHTPYIINRYEEAIASYDEAIRIDPADESARLYRNVAQSVLQLRNVEEKAIRTNPEYQATQNDLGNNTS